MIDEARHLRDEARELDDLLSTFDTSVWNRPTPFKGWTPFDVLAHLHVSDRSALLAATDPVAFRHHADERRAKLDGSAPGMPRERVETREPARLLEDWRRDLHRLCDALDAHDTSARLPWFGPDMALRTFTAARLMEVWAHGQDLYDVLRKPRTHSDRIRPIADLGVRTFGWTFANRGLEVPGTRPHVSLVAPSGAQWRWNEPSSADRVTGDAAEFCHVVTQGRNVRDTGLEVTGPVATRWMAIAQCFAGVPKDPPAPGERAWQ